MSLFAGFVFGVSHGKNRFAVQTAEDGEARAEGFLGGEELRVFVDGGGCGCGCGCVLGGDEVEDGITLLSRFVRGGKDGCEDWVGDD